MLGDFSLLGNISLETCGLVAFSCDLALDEYGLELSLGIFRWRDLSLGIFRLGSSLQCFGKASLENFGLGTLAWELSLES